jgi:nucleoid DNA-binding protein
LRPVKRKQISAIVADRLNLSGDTVDEIMSSYYKHILKMLVEMEHTRIYVNKLGTFVVNRKKLIEKHKMYTQALEKLEKIEEPNFQEYKNISNLKNELQLFEKILANFNEENEKRLQKEEEKRNYKKQKNELN